MSLHRAASSSKGSLSRVPLFYAQDSGSSSQSSLDNMYSSGSATAGPGLGFNNESSYLPTSSPLSASSLTATHAPAAAALLRRAQYTWKTKRKLITPLALLSTFILLVASSDSNQRAQIKSTAYNAGHTLSGLVFRKPAGAQRFAASSPNLNRITTNAPRRREWKSPQPALPLDASLHDRLQDLWDAPLSEPANWVKHNAQVCSKERVKMAQNDWITQDAALVWHSLNSTDIKNYRKNMIDFLVEAEKQGLMAPDKYGSGRGLVFTAGNADTFSRVLMSLKILRKYYNTSLPAEIFSFPGEEPPAELLPQFAEYNVTLRYIKDASRDTSRVKNYQIKSDAIVASSFAEVLYLDSDNMPAAHLGNHDGTFDSSLIKEHELIWNAPAYKRLGAMFWPDYWKTGPMNPIWAIIGTQCRDEWEQEAGQILIDKRRHLDALLLANWMLDDWEFWFRLSDGDKDIFRFAFLALRKRWAVPGRYVGAAALAHNTPSGFCGHTMLQHDHLGYPIFVHANLLKQIPSGVGRGFTWGRTRQTGLFNGGDPHIEGGEGSGDVEADMLANAASDGTAIIPAVSGVRYRAALERGLYTRFHGGSISALCVDLHYEDPRTKAEKEADLKYAKKHPEPLKDKEGKTHEPGKVTHGMGVDGEPIEIHWDISPVMVGWWRDEPRIANFEKNFYNEGGKPGGSGFT